MLDQPQPKFQARFNNHKSRVNAHVNLTPSQKERDDFIYQHFNGQDHRGLKDMSVQLIDWVEGARGLREKEGQWIN